MAINDHTVAIVLGVSECPKAPNLQPLPQCAASASEFDAYLHNNLKIPANRIRNMFDSELSASDQLDDLEEWLHTTIDGLPSQSNANLIVFYTGHGGFSKNDQSYFLATRRTRAGSEGASSIRYVDLASILKRRAERLRKYLILDCCFAAAAVVRMQADLAQLVIQRVEDELPPSGTAVLCSSAAKLVSIAPPGEPYTMFSGALLQCLREGVPSNKMLLTLEDVGSRVRRLILEKFPNDAVRPELHVPEQFRGNPAEVPIFPNNAWAADAPVGQQPLGRTFASKQKDGLDRQSRPDDGTTFSYFFVIASLASVGSALLFVFGPKYFVLRDTYLAPLGPAIGLLFGVSALFPKSLLHQLGAAVSIALPWQAAWATAFFLAPRLDSIAIATAIGSILGFGGTFIGLRVVRYGRSGFQIALSEFFGRISLFAATSAIPFVVGRQIFGEQAPTGASYMLCVFITWQFLFLFVLRRNFQKLPADRTEFILATAMLACAMIIFLPSPMRVSLDRLASSPATKSTGVELNISTIRDAGPISRDVRRVTVIGTIDATTDKALDCQLFAFDDDGQHQYERERPDLDIPTIYAAKEEFKIAYKVPANVSQLSLELICNGTLVRYYTTRAPYSISH